MRLATTTFFKDVPAVEKVGDNEHSFLPTSASVQAMLAPKATATLCKRMCSMRMYMGWYNLSRLPQSGALFEVAHVFAYLKELYNCGAPASRGPALCGRLASPADFCVCVSTPSTSRAECVACAAHCSAQERPPDRGDRSRSAWSWLEKTVAEDEGRGELDAIVAGADLFAVHGRVRVGDLRWCIEEPELDLTEGVGFLDTHFTEHKTARAGTKRALPIACSADGLTSKLWGRLWLQARVAFAEIYSKQCFLHWAGLATAFTTPEFSAAFREVLLRRRFSSEDLENVGAHSLKDYGAYLVREVRVITCLPATGASRSTRAIAWRSRCAN